MTHGLVAVTLVRAWPFRRRPWRLYALAAACSILPDADVIAFSFGIPYSHLLGHRGLSHSLLFALAIGLLAAWLVRMPGAERRIPAVAPQISALPFSSLAACLFLATASHGALDAMTDGGLGVAFFAPLDESRYFLPFRPLRVSPISVSAFFSSWGAQVMANEFVWAWVPCLALLAVLRLVAEAQRHRVEGSKSQRVKEKKQKTNDRRLTTDD